MRIYNLSKSARTLFFDKVSTLFHASDFAAISSRARDLKIAELDSEGFAIIFDRDTNLYFGRKTADDYFPLLRDEVVVPSLPIATVDSGAVKYVCNGANVMRPGIVSFSGDFPKGDIIAIREIVHSKAIAIGRALESRPVIEGMKKGPSVENLHYIGDKFWESLKGLVA